jgi:uncharacterized protein YabE (DUF348 family)
MSIRLSRLRLLLLAAALILTGLALTGLAAYQSFTIQVDGKVRQVKGVGLTVGQILRIADIAIRPGDRVTPPAGQWVLFRQPESEIRIERAAQFRIAAGGTTYAFLSTERRPANLLAQVKLTLYPGDQVLLLGLPVDPDLPLPDAEGYVLQVQRAMPITLNENGTPRLLFSSAATLGQALWQAGLRLSPDDSLSLGPGTPLGGAVQVSLKRAVPLSIRVDGKVVATQSSAGTVGQALIDAQIALETLDYSVPSESSPLPLDGQIRVVRVREDVVLEQKSIPFSTEYQPDPQTELDQRSILKPGVEGIQVSRVRIRYEDGKEVSRKSDAQWQAQAPQAQVVGYGTKVVIRTAVVDGVSITYWRAVSMYATAYSPCTQGYDFCTTSTASGAKLQKGVVGVQVDWYVMMKGQHIFVPGYGTGTIVDDGAGIPGEYHIDLGFSESDFVPWHTWTVVYFLTPVPTNIPWILQ